MNQKNTFVFIRLAMFTLCFLVFSSQICFANYQSGIRLFTEDFDSTCEDKLMDGVNFRTFSVMDIPPVMAYINHYECDGGLGTITIYATEGDDLTNLEISLDGGVSFVSLMPDNFNNLLLLNVEAGIYEIYVRLANDNDINNQRYIGFFELLPATEVDLDKDGYTKCEDTDDRDPCVPEDCDLAQGVGCDLSIIKNDYEWCHFEDLLNPQQLAIEVKMEDIEGYASYEWSNGDTTSTLLVSPISDSYYQVSVSDQSGCVLADSVFVKVYYIPFIDAQIIHQNCSGALGSIVLFSPIGESLDQLQLSLDNGETFQDPTFDNFGNIILFQLELGEYAITIRHKEQTQCVKDLGVFEVEDEQFFDEDNDGVLRCEDENDEDECVPTVCEICEVVSSAGFESADDSWASLSENVELSTENQRSGASSAKLSLNGSFIETEALSVDNQRSIKIAFSVYPSNLERNEGLVLSISSDGGSTYTVLNSWLSLVDFHNDEWFELNHRATIDDGITELQIRLSQSSSEFNDFMYIDDVTIEFCEAEYFESNQIVCELIHYDDVDAFLDFWSFGGGDANLSTNYSQSGQFSYHLKNGNGASSSIISNSLSTDGVGVLSVDFSYTPISMELREFFSLELSLDGGITYGRIQSWVSGEFENGTSYTETVVIPINRSANNLRLRFTNYGNSQFDHVYLDDIKVEYCEDISRRTDPQDAEVVIEFEKENSTAENPDFNLGFQSIDSGFVKETTRPSSIISIYPNPTADYINLSMTDLESTTEQLHYRFTDIAGQTHLMGRLQNQNEAQIDVTSLPSGTYIIQLFDEHKLHMNQTMIKI